MNSGCWAQISRTVSLRPHRREHRFVWDGAYLFLVYILFKIDPNGKLKRIKNGNTVPTHIDVSD